VEFRAAVRYALRATVLFSWERERGVDSKAEGVTRDMSTHGVFVYSLVLPPEDTSVRIEVTFPPLQEGAPPLQIDVQGRVVRVERNAKDSAYSGFAVSTERAILRGGEHSGAHEEDDDYCAPGGDGD
jgi:hypothetical protein